MRRRRVGGFLVIAVFVSMAAWAAAPVAATTVDVPLRNWAAPSTWTPTAPADMKGGVKAALVTTLFNPLPFVPLTPCRVVDTRSGSGFPAGYGPPALAALATRVFIIGGQCGIPTIAQAVSFQFTVVNMTANGNFRAWPDGVSMPTASVLNWTATSAVAGNGIVVPVGGFPAALDIYLNGPVSSTVDLVLDVNGYYSADVSSSSSQTFTITSNRNYGSAIYGFSTGLYGSGVAGVGYYGLVGSGTYGVYGNGNLGVAGFGSVTGVYGSSAITGVQGISSGASGALFGVFGSSVSTSPGAAGVRGQDGSGAPSGWANLGSAGVVGASQTSSGVTGIGMFGGGAGVAAVRLDYLSPYDAIAEADLAPSSGTAAWFWGDVYTYSTAYGGGNLNVTGNLTKGTGTFKIDHPLDPENKYLYHSFVESPDMMNVYNGVIVLGPDGSAVVKLPSYFEALNKDFRYQLTSIGMSQPELYVGLEVSNNEFVVAGGKPYGKVSWQVTGVRQDPLANAHRVVPEVDKEPEAKGYYLHPAAYGKEPKKYLGARMREVEKAREKETALGISRAPGQPEPH